MEFECTNNTDEYEALVLGLQKSIDIKVVVLKVVGDLDIMVHQVRNAIHCVSPRLKIYQQEVWRLISQFQVFNIILVPIMRNADALANTASRMSLLRDRFTVEILYKPSVPVNISNLHIFDDE